MKSLYFLSDFSIIVHLFFISDSRAEHRPERSSFFPLFTLAENISGGGWTPLPHGYATDLSYSESNFVKLIFKTCFCLITELMDHHELFLSQHEISTNFLELIE